MTVDEFLAWDDGTDTRYELIDGQIAAMNPPLALHARVVAQLGAALEQRAGENWSIKDYIGSGKLPLRVATTPLPLDEIYVPLEH
jgi:Uma2 family endonuclease